MWDNAEVIVLLIGVSVIALGTLLRIMGQRG
jgi:hypothetical protein